MFIYGICKGLESCWTWLGCFSVIVVVIEVTVVIGSLITNAGCWFRESRIVFEPLRVLLSWWRCKLRRKRFWVSDTIDGFIVVVCRSHITVIHIRMTVIRFLVWIVVVIVMWSMWTSQIRSIHFTNANWFEIFFIIVVVVTIVRKFRFDIGFQLK